MPMKLKSALIMTGLFALSVSGCATMAPMALSPGSDLPDMSKRSIVIMSLRVSNVYKTEYQPHAREIRIMESGKKGRRYRFTVGEPVSKSTDSSNQFEEYMVSLALSPGAYELTAVTLQDALVDGSTIAGVIKGEGYIPILVKFEVSAGRIAYAGRIEAVRRERKDETELRADLRGSPNIVKYIYDRTGSDGAYEVRITDDFERDIARFAEQNPFLGKFPVEIAVLPPWEKPALPPEEIRKKIGRDYMWDDALAGLAILLIVGLTL